ncbi:Ribosomal RNA small subunit methyltransferase NEP1 [Euphorbia peplus]|nr:Ribosomal RNA small subunit methyltransferase NEP1 [Euphorbia peplus]
MLKRKRDLRKHNERKMNKGKVMLKRKRDDQEHNQSSEVVVKKDKHAVVDDIDKKIRVETCIQALKSTSPAIFVLENASLTKGFVRKKPKVLNGVEDANFLLRQGKQLDDYCPEIVFDTLREILDSTANGYGMLGAVYIRTDSGVLFEIKPHVRIPRDCKRFCGLILKLLEKSSIRAEDTGEVLMRVLKEPLSQHLPKNAHVIGLSYNSPKMVNLENYVGGVADDVSPVFVVGTNVRGEVGKDNCDDYISASDYQLGSRCCAGFVCAALEQKWKLF